MLRVIISAGSGVAFRQDAWKPERALDITDLCRGIYMKTLYDGSLPVYELSLRVYTDYGRANLEDYCTVRCYVAITLYNSNTTNTYYGTITGCNSRLVIGEICETEITVKAVYKETHNSLPKWSCTEKPVGVARMETGNTRLPGIEHKRHIEQIKSQQE